MTHWSEAWLGVPHVRGSYDCLDFVCDVLRHQFGVELRIPERHATGPRGWAGEIAAGAREVAARREGDPLEGDGVLMRPAGVRLGAYHVGLWCAPAGDPSTLHCMDGLGSVLFPLRGLAARGWEIEGVYRWL